MASKRKTTKRGKKLAGAKKLGKVKPLLKYELSGVYISSNTVSGNGGPIPSE
ncbi:MAG: hypothetical protein WA211_11165 [Candidatus Acidiferrales bacterium]